MKSLKLLGGLAVVVALALGGSTAANAQAENWPSKPVRFITGDAAGGASDIMLRAIGEEFTKRTGQPFIIENMPGGRQVPAVMEAKKADADGYTFMQVTQNAMTLNPLLIKDLQYSVADFEPVSMLVNQQHAITFRGPAGTDWQNWTYKDLVEYSKANPDKIFFGSIGIGSGSHLSFEWQMAKTGAKYTHVPYSGSPEVFQAFRAGDIHLFQLTVNKEVRGMYDEGIAKPLAVPNKGGNPMLPGVPTFDEAVAPGYAYLPWTGWWAPKGTPIEIRNKLQALLKEITDDPDFSERYIFGGGYLPVISTPDEFAAYMADDAQNHRALLAIAGIETN